MPVISAGHDDQIVFMNSNHTDISIVICTYNRASLLSKCLKSLSAMDHDFGATEVLVVDNNSRDDTAAVCNTAIQQYPQLHIRYILEQQQGVGYTRTRGATEAKGTIIAYIDDDCQAETNWITAIKTFYDAHPEAMSTGGCIKPDYNVPLPDWYGRFFWGLVGHYELGDQVFRMQGARYPSGANMHFRKAAFERYGYFDGQLGRKAGSLMAGEEKAMYLKLLKAGEHIYYLPSVKVYHFVDSNKFDPSYVKKHSMGIGASERLMNNKSTWKLFKKFLEYVAKWGFAVAYGFGYLFKGQYSKMKMLVLFRWWVLMGFFYPARV